jgi:putative FmdB family regulatory protein
MPFYEYECQACKFYTEVMQKITDAPLAKCPSCGKRALKKLLSAPVFRLKGGGWYETDFKSEKENKRNLVGADKEESKPEAKPEAKGEAAAAPDKGSADPKDVKAGAAKASEPKATPKSEPPARAARNRVSVGAKSARARVRKPKRPAKGKGGRRR